MKNNGSANPDEEVTSKIAVKHFISHHQRMNDLEAALYNANKLAEQAGECVKECLGYLALAQSAFEAMKD